MAVMRPYGGLKSGRPRGPVTKSRVPFLYRRFVRLGSPGIRSAANVPVTDGTYNIPVSGSNAAPFQSAPPTEPGSWSVPLASFGPPRLIEGGVKRGPMTYRLVISTASARSSGVKSIRSSIVTPGRSKGAGLVGNGCVGEV